MSALGDARREEFEKRVLESRERAIDLCVRLTRTNSENPPGDTNGIVSVIDDYLASFPRVKITRVCPKEPIVNLLVELRGSASGSRLVFNGHLDTFPVGNKDGWSVPPLGGVREGNRIYGRGVSDMKAGLAASIITLALFAEHCPDFPGALVLTLVGDEETGGRWGTQYMLDHSPEALGDAMISGDAGSPQVVRFGEKGQLWLEVVAKGTSAHGAHVHLGVNAIDRLTAALARLHTLGDVVCAIPSDIKSAISEAAHCSERVSGRGETETLQRVTVNVGTIEGGIAVNIVPDLARARLDIRFPPGWSSHDAMRVATAAVTEVPGIELRQLGSSEANATNPRDRIVEVIARNASRYLRAKVVANMRLGFSDARFYRYKGVPSVVYGPTPHGMGGVDEYVTVDDLSAVLYVHAMSAFDFLMGS
jgi:acetylornithine deacetylase/succinyl-diaminopimelate desuccinylase-like protein